VLDQTDLQSTFDPRKYSLFFRNLVKPSEMPMPLALTGITAHTQKHFTSSDKTQKKKKIYISDSELFNATSVKEN